MVGAMLFFEVVTDQVLMARAQQESVQKLRASEARYRGRAELLLHCLEAAPFPIWAKDAQGRWLLANPAAAALLVPARPSLQGRPVDGDRSALHIERDLEERALREGATVRVEIGLFNAGNGIPRRLLVSMVPMRAGESGISGLMGFAHDLDAGSLRPASSCPTSA
ncbi:PAS domain-containing protein [Azohydromonas aeria]|uniref:PAS domain-containing protein n=1 Tax=Azohydromonas aeria TaxID=2590212 RepID=UPI0012FB5CA5|nr:PAS domain-containing protein [Azohydromonas aeria]